MEPVYIDLHIHTSPNPNEPNESYDVDTLLSKIGEVSKGSDFLISLTDHNMINETAYLNLIEKTKNVILGAELHIKNYPSEPPYHCHIFINSSIDKEVIENLNVKLDKLYSNKEVTPDTTSIPSIEDIIRSFDDYDFILLPHGGQSHSTFDKSIPDGVKFDTTLEKSIYYNQFDGFTARNSKGLEETVKYFKRLGINEFVNLVTCTDNYEPDKYPNAKANDAKPFVPTWMYALPTFNGLRLSLSESSRFVYNDEKPKAWSEYIKSVKLKNGSLDIDISLTPGLNVVIGGSSSGKTLLVDSIYRKLTESFEGSDYSEFGIEEIIIQHPSGCKPHYINQNYVMKVIDKKDQDNRLEHIDIIKTVFPEDKTVTEKIERSLSEIKRTISDLVKHVESIEAEENKLARIPVFSRLILSKHIKVNPISKISPSEEDIEKVTYEDFTYHEHIVNLDEIFQFSKNNIFVEDIEDEIKSIKEKLGFAFAASQTEDLIRSIIIDNKKEIDDILATENSEQQIKRESFNSLLQSLRKYSKEYRKFKKIVDKLKKYSVKFKTKTIESMGHQLSIENTFRINDEILLHTINKFLKTGCKIAKIDGLEPNNLYYTNFSQKSPKVQNYDDFSNKIYSELEGLNSKSYKITTKNGKDFDNLSAGWKTSVILDLLLGYEKDLAPLIIDQPEDNLATSYINKGLIEAIKNIKTKKQIILVSHNATIPMLGDAQNIVLCKNDGSIIIRSNPMEGFIDGNSLVSYIAEITDGGKPSIKKRVKKYNLKNYREE